MSRAVIACSLLVLFTLVTTNGIEKEEEEHMDCYAGVKQAQLDVGELALRILRSRDGKARVEYDQSKVDANVEFKNGKLLIRANGEKRRGLGRIIRWSKEVEEVELYLPDGCDIQVNASVASVLIKRGTYHKVGIKGAVCDLRVEDALFDSGECAIETGNVSYRGKMPNSNLCLSVGTGNIDVKLGAKTVAEVRLVAGVGLVQCNGKSAAGLQCVLEEKLNCTAQHKKWSRLKAEVKVGNVSCETK